MIRRSLAVIRKCTLAMRSNCVRFAYMMRARHPGSYVAWRHSRAVSWLPHCIWVSVDHRHWVSLSPEDALFCVVRDANRWNPLPYVRAAWFCGRLKWGDRPV